MRGEHRRPVVRRIETDRQQPDASRSSGSPCDSGLLHALKCRSINGQKLGSGQRVYMNVTASACPRQSATRRVVAVLIDESRHRARRSRFRGGSRAGAACRLGDRRRSRSLERSQVRAGLFDDERGPDEVAGHASLQQRRVPHLERHRHPRHEARDVFVLDRDFLTGWIDGDDHAAQLVLARAWRARRGRDCQCHDRSTTRIFADILQLYRAALQPVKGTENGRFGRPGSSACILLYSPANGSPPLACGRPGRFRTATRESLPTTCRSRRGSDVRSAVVRITRVFWQE